MIKEFFWVFCIIIFPEKAQNKETKSGSKQFFY